VVLGAYTHQALPFDKLVEVLQPKRSLSYTPVFQVKLVFQNMPMPRLELPDLNLKPFEIENKGAKFDLTLFVMEQPHGLEGTLEYNTALFAPASIARMVAHFETLLASMAAQPDARLSQLPVRSHTERKQQVMDTQDRKNAKLNKFLKTVPKTVNLAQQDVVTIGLLQPEESLPGLIQPAVDDVDLAGWAATNKDLIETTLGKHAAILFRGFNINSVAAFERFALTLCSELFKENGEHTPVSASNNVQTPVFYAPEKKLLWHNENSFNQSWPLKIFFCCVQPAEAGGETPLVDSRKVFQLIDPAVRERFMEQQVMYVRNYGDGVGRDWQTVFRTTDKDAVEAYCQANAIQFEWKSDNRLRTRQVRPAVTRHPKTGDLAWFAQLQHWHISCLDPATRTSLQSMFQEEDLPRNCYYGDGSPIEDSVIQAISDVYQQLEVSFPWQKGDLVLVDNMLAAHARNAFVGERKILVALGEMSSFDAL
jgi:alpha-ketoglutarate-dependent taurine dioxygenase